jgi:hypothetical protein
LGKPLGSRTQAMVPVCDLLLIPRKQISFLCALTPFFIGGGSPDKIHIQGWKSHHNTVVGAANLGDLIVKQVKCV